MNLGSQSDATNTKASQGTPVELREFIQNVKTTCGGSLELSISLEETLLYL